MLCFDLVGECFLIDVLGWTRESIDSNGIGAVLRGEG